MRNSPLLVACLFGLLGCSSEPPFVDNSIDPLAFAKDIKETVLNHARLAKNSAEPADSIGVIVEAVSNLSGSPTGEHLATYEKILSTSKQLLDECASASSRPSGLNAKLDELIKIAETLPGEVKTERRRD